MMQDRTLAVARYLVIVFAGFVGVACPASAQDTDRDKGILPIIERKIFVELPDARTSTLSAEQKLAYDDGRRVLSHVRRRCVGRLNSEKKCDRGVDVLITAVEGAKYVTSGKAPDKPQLIAWIENLGRETTSDGLLPGRQARYALLVNSVMSDTRQGKRPELLLVQIDNPEKPPVGPFSARQRVYGHVFECHRFRQPYLSDVDFRLCDIMRASVTPGTGIWKGEVLATSLLTFAAQRYLDDPIWFSCASGCCTSAQPQ